MPTPEPAARRATGGSGGLPRPGGTGAGSGPVPAECAPAAVPITVLWGSINSQAAAFYGTPEALTLAQNILYYQNVDRGWPKDTDMTTRAEAQVALDDRQRRDHDANRISLARLRRHSVRGVPRRRRERARVPVFGPVRKWRLAAGVSERRRLPHAHHVQRQRDAPRARAASRVVAQRERASTRTSTNRSFRARPTPWRAASSAFSRVRS